MTTIACVARHATSEQVDREIGHVAVISDSAAVAIASWWQGPDPRGLVMARLAQGTAVDVEDVLESIDYHVGLAGDDDEADELAALRTWAERKART